MSNITITLTFASFSSGQPTFGCGSLLLPAVAQLLYFSAQYVSVGWQAAAQTSQSTLSGIQLCVQCAHTHMHTHTPSLSQHYKYLSVIWCGFHLHTGAKKITCWPQLLTVCAHALALCVSVCMCVWMCMYACICESLSTVWVMYVHVSIHYYAHHGWYCWVCASMCTCDQMRMRLSVTKHWCGWMYVHVHVSIHYYVHHNLCHWMHVHKMRMDACVFFSH